MQESTEKERFKESFLGQLLFLNEPALFLAVQTSGKAENGFTFQDLVEIIKKYPSPFPFLMTENMIQEIVIDALDTLLDSAIYSTEWRLLNNKWKKIFLNRNELFHVFDELKEDLLSTSLDHKRKSEVIYKTRKNVYLREPLDETSKLHYSERIKKVERELKEFIDKRLVPKLSCEEDVVLVPIMRKGTILIEQLKKDTGLKNCNICFPIYLKPEQLNNKKIVLFDDAIHEGKNIEKYFKKLQNLSSISYNKIDLDNVKVVTYLLNEEVCSKSEICKRLLVEPYKKCSDWEFRREVSDLLMYIAHLGEIKDPDNLVVNAKFVEQQKIDKVLELFKNLGIENIVQSPLNYLHPNKMKITLNLTEQEYSDLTGELPEYVDGIDMCGVHFIFELNQKNHKAQIYDIVPVVLPVVNNLQDNQQNKVIKEYGFNLDCKRESYDSIPCYIDTIIYHMTTSFFKEFFGDFSKISKERNMQLKKGSISSKWEYLTTKHPAWANTLQDFSKELEQYIK